MSVNIKLSSFKYIFTNIGGGWGTIHSFYGVTNDDIVYTTRKFANLFTLDTELECELLGRLDNTELGLNEVRSYAIMDGSCLTVYDVNDNFKVIHCCDEGTDSDPDLYKRIIELEHKFRQERVGSFPDFVIGEVNSEEYSGMVQSILSSGSSIVFSCHARPKDTCLKHLLENL